VSALYVYALLGEPPAGAPGVGLRRERLEVVRCGRGVFAVVGRMPAPPPLDAVSIRGHAAAIRRLSRRADAILPARFGSVVADARTLVAAIRPRLPELSRALAAVTGREQMTLRLYGPPGPPDGPPPVEAADDPSGPGARYLSRRLRDRLRKQAVPELEPIRPLLRDLVEAERVARHDTPPLIASVYHLIPRGRGRAYRARVARATARLDATRIGVSGPWAPYAFAPEDLA
jgi:hypothetical protein